MSLRLLQPNTPTPIGQFDGLDSEVLSLKGGEVVSLKSVLISSGELSAFDAKDGYQNPGTKRVVVTKTLTSGNRPLYLADEGITGYGTIFGSVVGGTVGQVTNGALLGPSTATGSGKVTCWGDVPGTYAVSLDNVDTNAVTGLVPTNATLVAGAPLYATAAGLLTPLVGSSFEAGLKVATFIDFETNGSLVTTPNYLTAALNSPSGPVSYFTAKAFTHAVFRWSAVG
jgi:hypothetical protein